jgi:hypothetical protein
MPYMNFPLTWPAYIPKDKIAGWFEAYVESMELNYWTATEFEGGAYNEKEGRWSVMLRRDDGTKREMHPRHVVLATGVSGIPSLPEIPTLRDFGGAVLHSSQYDDGEMWRGKRVLVIGSGNSGHDIAQDLHSSGARVTLVQRSSTMIVNVEPSAQLPYALYDEGPSLEDCAQLWADVDPDTKPDASQGRRCAHPLFELRCEALIRRTFEDAIRVRDRNRARQPQSCAHEQARIPPLSASEHQHVEVA